MYMVRARGVRWFPPHARGWTAGRSVVPARGLGFPRTRGDGPRARRGAQRRGWLFPPHARGWTRCSELTDRATEVSPARAGMDRSRRRSRSGFSSFPPHARGWTHECFPRTRGEWTFRAIRTRRVSRFPPHARGWTARSVDEARRFPRSGDGPQTRAASFAVFPPHARGWTHG